MENYNTEIKAFADKIKEADAIVLGAGSGMSAAAGLRHFYERDKVFIENFGEFEKKYGFSNTFDGFYHHYGSHMERWGFIARFVHTILTAQTGKPYYDFKEILEGKNYHILTTNQDTQFTRLFPENKISAIQGDWRYLQCSERCHDKIYNAVDTYEAMNKALDEDLSIPAKMLPYCPHCGALMEPWVRSYVFLEGKKYREEYEKLNIFLEEYKDKKLLLIELGVGRMTPMFIQRPFWNLTYSLPKAYYVTVNPKDAILPDQIAHKGMALHYDIAQVTEDTLKALKES